MDWSRVKNVLIIIFIVLNLFLLVNLILLKSNGGISAETLKNTKLAIENRGIHVNCDIPGYNVDNVKLSYDVDESERSKILTAFINSTEIPKDMQVGKNYEINNFRLVVDKDGTVTVDFKLNPNEISPWDEKGTREYLSSKLKKAGISFKDFTGFTDSTGQKLRVEYIQKYKNYYVYDNFFKLMVDKEGQCQIQFNYKKVIELKKDKASSTKPVYQILLSNLTKGKAGTIFAIDAGFKNTNDGNDSKNIEQRPVWRVKFSDGNSEYYNVYTGMKVN